VDDIERPSGIFYGCMVALLLETLAVLVVLAVILYADHL